MGDEAIILHGRAAFHRFTLQNGRETYNPVRFPPCCAFLYLQKLSYGAEAAADADEHPGSGEDGGYIGPHTLEGHHADEVDGVAAGH